MNSVMEFILRMKDEASAGLQRVKTAIKGASAEAGASAPELKKMGQSFTETAAGFAKAREAMMKVVGVGGMVVATFTASYNAAKPLAEYLKRMWDPVARAAFEWPKLEEAMKKTAEWIKQQASDEKERVGSVRKAYDEQADAIKRAADARRLMQSAKSTNLSPDEAESDYKDSAAIRDVRKKEVGALRADLEAEKAKKAALAEQEKGLLKPAMKMGLVPTQGAIGMEWKPGLVPDDEANAKRKSSLTNILAADRLADAKIEQIKEQLSAAKLQMADADASYAAAIETVEAAKAAQIKSDADAWDAYEQADSEWLQKRAEDEQASIKEQADERARLADAQAEKDHSGRVDNIKAEAAVSEQAASDAQARLSRAHEASQQAWGWYRDPESFKRQRAEESADAQAEKQFSKDARSLTSRSGWRDARLDDRQESVRRVVLAREEERAAQTALTQIEINTRGLAQKMEQLLSMRGG